MLDIQKHNLIVEKTAKYCQLGIISTKTESIWYVLHGYGQLVDYFIQNFDSIVNEHTVIIAPEGFSRFYLNGFSGRVGASWMTKEERLIDIGDYGAYLDKLHQHCINQVENKLLKINVLGFSQGGATACRWLATSKFSVQNLILWSCIFPEDMHLQDVKQLSEKNKTYIVYGKQDSFLNENAKQRLEFWKNSEISIITFDGGHKIDKDTLLYLNQNELEN